MFWAISRSPLLLLLNPLFAIKVLVRFLLHLTGLNLALKAPNLQKVAQTPTTYVM
jgi:hypothetical protein